MDKVLAIICLMLIEGSAYAQATEYVNSKYGFSIQLPKGWKITEPGIEKTGPVVNNFAVRATHSGMAINVAVDDWYTNRLNDEQRKTMTRGDIDAYWDNEKSINDIAEPSIAKVKTSLERFQLLEQSILDFDETKALHWRYSTLYRTENGEEVELMLIVRMLIKNGIQYAISASTQKDAFESVSDLLLKSINSFHAPFNLSESQKAGALPPRANVWKRFIAPVFEKAAAQMIIGCSIALIVGAIAIVRARRAARKHKDSA